ncbi:MULTISPECIES: DUF2268 domain-containing putative Zn-dependent protease [unclassified Psychrobacillus]|uniref:DUF2268 domain-containing protein n=1 Tax=unclassified Psychrobacillus TaxID=2636677 RepID=UPI00146C893B|nr:MULTISPECIES: DUF2268 domain-containing putative Zn-dependent protease [unclassified Psychrobacillus]MCM3360191.1 DUF2268 domain-containing protein [Psychrobacillus sp. MER TA 171]NME04405.1 DUF2268 domain-containing protein [Psychrobacillus sp. BL-248-WT-3]
MINYWRMFIFVVISLLLFGCNEDVEKPEILLDENPVILEHNGQQFELYKFYDEYENFIEKAEKEPDNIKVLFQQEVMKAFGESTNHTVSLYEEISEPTKIDEVREYLTQLRAQEDDIDRWIKEALEDSGDKLPGEDKKVYIFPSFSEEVSLKELEYVSGLAIDKEGFILMINPLFTERSLKYTVAHEYHHTVAMESGRAKTLLERSVLEGKADTFAKIIYPEMEPAWLQPLSGYYKEHGWEVFMENLNSEESEIWNFLFIGNHFKGIAKWTNYKIGYEIMQNFLKENRDVSIGEWTKMSAQDILAKSQYTD